MEISSMEFKVRSTPGQELTTRKTFNECRSLAVLEVNEKKTQGDRQRLRLNKPLPPIPLQVRKLSPISESMELLPCSRTIDSTRGTHAHDTVRRGTALESRKQTG